MAASVSRQFGVRPAATAFSSLQKGPEACLRNYSRSRKSQLDFKGLQAIWKREIPQSEWINPSRNRPWSQKTIERRLRAPKEWSISSEELKQIRERNNTGARVKVPVHLRAHRPGPVCQALREQEKARIMEEFPREIDNFRAGDRLEIHRYIELGKPKIEVVRGICIGRRHPNQVHGTFKIINVLSDTPFILTYPVYSPYITKIKVIEKSQWTRNKLNFLKEWPLEAITTV